MQNKYSLPLKYMELLTCFVFNKLRQEIRYLIRKHYRQLPRPGLIPTFEEFLQFVSGRIPTNRTEALRKLSRTNNHWKPVYLNCAPCSEPYTIIAKMETFDQDVDYIRRRLGLHPLKNSDHVGQQHAADPMGLNAADLTGQESTDQTRQESADRTGQESADQTRQESADRIRQELADQTRQESADRTRQESADQSKQESADWTGQESADWTGQESADRTSQAAAVEAFSRVNRSLVEQVYQIYEPDFVLFGYNANTYLNIL